MHNINNFDDFAYISSSFLANNYKRFQKYEYELEDITEYEFKEMHNLKEFLDLYDCSVHYDDQAFTEKNIITATKKIINDRNPLKNVDESELSINQEFLLDVKLIITGWTIVEDNCIQEPLRNLRDFMDKELSLTDDEKEIWSDFINKSEI
jgi:glutaredoxin-related protein